ncbi:Ig-like domain-containing protein [Cohnella sp. GCM10020058]|uniref:Ig-like domain-containing protein n=1 Tax=Cohnella sp. GCM10020058 TaxID=3317330 RepID=UPI0036341BD1
MTKIKRFLSILLVFSLLLVGAVPVMADPASPPPPEAEVPGTWQSPLPGLNAVASDGTTVVAVGADGTIVSSSGGTWEYHNSEVVTDLNDIVYEDDRFVAVGGDGTIVTSSDGTDWASKSLQTNQSVNGIVYGNDTYVAIGDGGSIFVSNDGMDSWTDKSDSAIHENLNAIVYDGDNFVAVGDGGMIVSSTDGQTWNSQMITSGLNSNSELNLNGISYGADLLVAVGADGEILTASKELDEWTNQGSFGANFNRVIYGDDGFIAVGNAGKLLISADGMDWADHSSVLSGTTDDLLGIIYTGTIYCIVSSEGNIFASLDGTEWLQSSLITPSRLNTIVYANGTYLTGGADGYIGTSTDGRIWSKANISTVMDVYSIAYGKIDDNTRLFTAVGSSGGVVTSDDNGATWSEPSLTPGDTDALHGVVYGDQFLAVGDNGNIITSSDGDSWEKVTVATDKSLYAVAYGGKDSQSSIYVAVGEEGTILTSADGTDWSEPTPEITSGTTEDLKSVSFGSGTFVAVGTSGTVLSSTDGEEWTTQTSKTTVDLNAVSFGDGVFLAAGANGNVIYSVDLGKTWVEQDSTHTNSNQSLNGIGYNADTYRQIAVGDAGTMIASNAFYSSPLVVSFSPAFSATEVDLDANLVLTFNQNVKPGEDASISIYDADEIDPESEDNFPLLFEDFAPNSSRIKISGNVVTIDPEKEFDANKTYIVTIESNMFQNSKGKESERMENDNWKFTTQSVPDTEPPTVKEYAPGNEDTDVPIGTDLKLTFSENVFAKDGNIEIYDSTNDDELIQTIAVGSPKVDVTGKVVTIDPSDLDFKKSYYVKIDSGAFEDEAGNAYAGISDSETWHFTTAEKPDTNAPTLLSHSPTGNNVLADSKLELSFSENVKANSGNGNIVIYKSADQTPVQTIPANSGDVLIVGTEVTITLNKLAYDTSYFVKIDSGAFVDEAATPNAYAGINDNTTWTFKTENEPDTTPPAVTSYSPTNGAFGVGIGTDLTLTFTENVTATDFDIEIYKSTDVETPVQSIDATKSTIQGNVVTIHPSAALAYNTSYFVKIVNGTFKDAAGNKYAGISESNVWQFTTTTEPDTKAPTVISYSPAKEATGVAIDTNLQLTFSENVKASDADIKIYKSTNAENAAETILAISNKVSITGNVVTINPSADLEYNTIYYVKIDAGAFKDLANNNYAGIEGSAWSFKTESAPIAPDTTAPTVTSVSPADNATNVSATTNLSIVFSENVVAKNFNIIVKNEKDDAVVATIKANNTALVTVADKTVTIKTSDLLKKGISYYVLIEAGAFADASDNSFAGITDKTAWNFATESEPVTPPSGGGAPSGPVTETIPANVENGAAQGSTVSNVSIKRTTDSNGVKKDDITFTVDQASQTVSQLKAAGSHSAKIIVPDEKDEVAETKLTLPKATTQQFAENQIDLDFFTVNAEVKVPSRSLTGFGDDIYFNLVPLKAQQLRTDAEARAKAQVQLVSGDAKATLVGRPITIDTNLQNREVTLALPLDASLTAEQLLDLAIFIEHSDGTKELVKGQIVPYGQTGKSGISFTVNKFSTFTVVRVEGLNPAVEVKAYMTGYADGTFGPGKSITRAEAATIIARTFKQTATGAAAAYTDVAADHWAADAIGQVSQSGIMKGYADGSFKPNQTITRAEMATMLARLITGVAGNAASFSDIAGHWAQAAIESTAKAGIVSGYEDGTFRPSQTLTRAEAVTIINRALGIAPLTTAAQKWTDVPAQHWAYGNIQAASVDHTVN